MTRSVFAVEMGTLEPLGTTLSKEGGDGKKFHDLCRDGRHWRMA